jgi:hypothetical protein
VQIVPDVHFDNIGRPLLFKVVCSAFSFVYPINTHLFHPLNAPIYLCECVSSEFCEEGEEVLGSCF